MVDIMDQEEIGFEKGWTSIEDLAIKPLLRLLDQGIASTKGTKAKKLFAHAEYMEAYTLIYRLCTQRKPYNFSAELYAKHGEVIRTYLQARSLPMLKSKRDGQLLNEFVSRWDSFQILNKWMNKFLTYLDRFHIQHHMILSLKDNALAVFKTVVFDEIHPMVTQAVLKMIEAERNGEAVDQTLLSRCVEVYRLMDKDMKSYEKAFEEPFKEQSEVYYKKKAQEWLVSDSTPQYLLKTEEAVVAESRRVAAYLHPQTEGQIQKLLVKTLLQKQEMTLLEKEGSGVKALLRDEKKDDLARVFRMFKEVEPGGLDPIATMVQQHITQDGKLVLEKREQALQEALEQKENANDSKYIMDLLDLHAKYNTQVQNQFQNHPLFQKALKTAFETTINTDVGKHSNAELLSTYADTVLRSGGEEKLTEIQIEDVLEKVVQLFFFISDKDVFADVYRNHLAKRLLNQRSASTDAEKSMIQKLKIRCGAQFTSKLEGMMTDLMLGQDLQKKFQTHVSALPETERPPIEFSCEVLTSGHWPTYKILEPTLPPVLARCVDVFEKFYGQSTDHRKLTWVHSLGNALVKANFKMSYELQVTTLQCLALVAFNDVPEGAQLTFAELHEKLGKIDIDVMKKIVHSLACQKIKVLVKEPDTRSVDVSVDKFKVNTEFQSKIRKVRIPMASLDDSHNPQRVEEDRSLAIEAAIVRIMKARKQLQHNLLVTEVVQQLQNFKPHPRLIKKRIEHLIERDYLARDETEQNVYKYLA